MGSVKQKDLGIGYHKGKPSNDHWEKAFPMSEKGTGEDSKDAFLPRSGAKRDVPHTKINECDH